MLCQAYQNRCMNSIQMDKRGYTVWIKNFPGGNKIPQSPHEHNILLE